MLKYIKDYPMSIIVIVAILFLSFFNPPHTDMEQIPYIDKIVHMCMYGGFVTIVWIEYFRIHRSIQTIHLILGGIIAPALMSGGIELLQEYCTENRGGEWLDFAANCTGVVLGALFGFFVSRPLIWKYFPRKD